MVKSDESVLNENEGYVFEFCMCLYWVCVLILKCNIFSGVCVINDLF